MTSFVVFAEIFGYIMIYL